MAEGIDELLKDIDNVLGDQTESTKPKEDKEDDADSLMSEIDSVLSPQQPAEEKPKEEIPQAVTPEKPKAVPSTLPALVPVKEPEVDFSKPVNIVSAVITPTSTKSSDAAAPKLYHSSQFVGNLLYGDDFLNSRW